MNPHDGRIVLVPDQGGGGDAWLSVTCNDIDGYFPLLGASLRDFLDGRRADDLIATLAGAVAQFRASPDYRKAPPSSAGDALNLLLNWARRYPNAVFEVT